MKRGGLFITLYEKDTLRLYLEKGVYGQHMKPQEDEPSSHSPHYRTLADYASARDGKHVFFFLKRKIYYGGQITGPDSHGAFYINGQKSPLGRESDAPLAWDESKRDRYSETDEEGVFNVEDRGERCQPFLILFDDGQELAGTYIKSDQLYFELGEYPYPLPSNSIAGMGFCTITPGETEILLNLLENEPDGEIEPESDEEIEIETEPTSFQPEYGVDSLAEPHPESHLEASVIANPKLLPSRLQPGESVICRQTPISPFKPSNIDKADVCYFNPEEGYIHEGTIPNTIIELKIKKAGKQAAEQVKRYMKWLNKRMGEEVANRIDIYVLAPRYTSTFDDYIPRRFRSQITKAVISEDGRTKL